MEGAQLEGLTSQEAAARLKQYGRNSLEKKEQSLLEKLGKAFASPISLMLIAAAILSVISGKESDAFIITALLVVNIGIKFWHEHKADSATNALRQRLKSVVRTKRDSVWADVPSEEIVPGDIVELGVGGVSPADGIVRTAENLTLNKSMITGESLPQEAKVGDIAYAGSFVATGDMTVEITKTGSATYFGAALKAAESAGHRSALETDILTVSRYLSGTAILAIILLSVVFVLKHEPLLDLATLDLSLLIAGIPVALPTVMSLIMSVGVLQLAKEHAVVRRLSSLEDLADVDLLLSDKTGTLTENKLAVRSIELMGTIDEMRALALAKATEPSPVSGPIGEAIEARAKGAPALNAARVIPGDSERKRSTAIIEENGRRFAASLGAPQVIETLVDFGNNRDRYHSLVDEAAKRGERILALAVSETEAEEHMQLAALFSISDTIRADAPQVIKFLNEEGVQVKMLTGDSYAIGATAAKSLGFAGAVYRRDVFEREGELARVFEGAAAFTEVLPRDKLEIVKFAREHHTVAVTGDGVNDVPAVKAADVGIGVRNAVDALRETADIVLLTNGLAIIRNAVIEARTIFARLYHYTIFRISESFRVVITIAVSGLALGAFPLTPIQLILLALMNDVPVVSIAFDRVKIPRAPASVDVRRRFVLSSLLGVTGVVNSLVMLWLVLEVIHMPWGQVQSVFFLQLVVSGHLLMYVAHTEERWWKYLPSKQVLLSLTATQLFATALALFGVFTAALSWQFVLFIWIWCIVWMQSSEFAKWCIEKFWPAGKGAVFEGAAELDAATAHA